MYGLLLEAIYNDLKERYGEEMWQEIRSIANIEHHSFVTHEYYSEILIPQITNAVSIVTGSRPSDIMQSFGFYFVNYVSKYGYDTILKVLGRNMRDFLNGLDNLHEYLRMSYPKMSAPSFFCENENKDGLTLHYRSKRRGFIHYVMGQIRQMGLIFYKIDVEIEVVSLDESPTGTHAVLHLHFDNSGCAERERQRMITTPDKYSIKSEVFFKAFPFHVMFSRDMVMKSVGSGLSAIMQDVKGKRIDRIFDCIRPPIDFSFKDILEHTNTMFELQSRKAIRRKTNIIQGNTGMDHASVSIDDPEDNGCETNCNTKYLHLKGQMRFVPDWDSFVFLGTPILANLEHMYEMNLFINDLSMHDVSRDLVMVGTDRSKELKSALNQQKLKSLKLEEMMQLLDREIKRTDSLLYQMIPREVADSLRSGQPAVSTCRMFESVSVLFSKVEGFTEISMKIKPLEVVSLLNAMYTKFDSLTEKHRVYKVETVADSYMVVAGAPVEIPEHAAYICDMALDAVSSVPLIDDPSDQYKHVEIKVGIHSGTIVAGVVGMKMPRYCLFGDTVNTSSRMMSTGQAMRIQISQTTKQLLENLTYETEYRGEVELKGKGQTKTYWLKSRKGPPAHTRFHASQIKKVQSPSKSRSSHSSIATLEQILDSHKSMQSLIASSSAMSSVPLLDDLSETESTGDSKYASYDCQAACNAASKAIFENSQGFKAAMGRITGCLSGCL